MPAEPDFEWSPEAIEAAQAVVYRAGHTSFSLGKAVLDAAVKSRPVVALPPCPTCGGHGYVLCEDPDCHPGCRDAKCSACSGPGVERMVAVSEISEWLRGYARFSSRVEEAFGWPSRRTPLSVSLEAVPMTESCPTCGTSVRVVGSDEGTMHYERVAAGVSSVVPVSALRDWINQERARNIAMYRDTMQSGAYAMGHAHVLGVLSAWLDEHEGSP